MFAHRLEPLVAELAAELDGLGEVFTRGVMSAERHLQQPNGQGRPGPERLVLLAEAIECCRRGLQRAVEVINGRGHANVYLGRKKTHRVSAGKSYLAKGSFLAREGPKGRPG